MDTVNKIEACALATSYFLVVIFISFFQFKHWFHICALCFGLPGNNLNSAEAAKTVADMVVRMPQLTSVTHGMQQWLAVVCACEVVEQSPQRTLPSGLPDVRTMTELDLSRKQECVRDRSKIERFCVESRDRLCFR